MKKTIVKLAFVLSSLLAGCSNQTENEHSTNEIQVDTVKVFSLTKGRVEKQITLPGELLPFERVEIRPKVTGYIKQLKLDIGSIVKKGQALASIDSPEIQSRYSEASGKVQSSKAKYESSLDTYLRTLEASKANDVISSSEFHTARNLMFAD